MSRPTEATLKALQKLPGWRNALEEGAVRVTQLEASFTNWVYRCEAEGVLEPTTVLLRIYGVTTGLFSRQADLQNCQLVDAVGLAPKLLSVFDHGRIEEYLSNYAVLKAAQMREAEMSRRIARHLSQFHTKTSMQWHRQSDHSVPMVTIWDRLSDWHQLAHHKNPELLSKLGPISISPQICELERQSRQSAKGLLFCHFDLQQGNIMRAMSGEDVRFLDYEYACLAPLEFDLANHWCEWCADYDQAHPHLLDLTQFPTPPQQSAFIQHYLSSLSKALQAPSCMESYLLSALGPSWKGRLKTGAHEDLVEAFRLRVLSYVPLSHLLWALWGIVQASHSEMTGFDYASYAQGRLSIYRSLSNRPL